MTEAATGSGPTAVDGLASDATLASDAALAVAEGRVLAGVARGVSLDETLSDLCRVIESAASGAWCSVVLLDDHGRIRHSVAPSLSPEFVEGIDGAPIGPEAGSCGVACYFGAAAWACDIEVDRRWNAWRDSARSAGLRACYSCAIFSPTDQVLGSFALYWPVRHTPGPADRRLVDTATALAAVAIERDRVERAMAFAAKHDSLTGLPNRACFLDDLGRALSGPAARLGRVAVLFMDLDQFKVINDSFGHAVGDRVLVAVAERLETALRNGDRVGRFGGDEFTVLCQDVDSDGALAVARRVKERLRPPVRVGNRQFHLSASIGIALGDRNSRPQDLLRNADLAMYLSKRHGRGGVEIFDASLLASSRLRYEDEAALRRTLAAGDITLHYQLIIDLATRRASGMEALLRWRRSDGEPVPSPQIVELAEEVGLSYCLGRHILTTAVDQLAELRAADLVGPDFAVSVNMTADQLTDPDLVSGVAEILSARDVAPGQLCLELTESNQLGEEPAVRDALGELDDLGVRIVIDDFGTGYSSIARLRALPVRGIKVDRSFVAGIDRDPKAVELLRGMLAVARALELPAVAEGVETAGQFAVLAELGCEECQGFWLAEPQPVDGLRRLLATRPTW